MVDHMVLGMAPRPRRRRSEELALLVQGLALTNPEVSLRGIGSQLDYEDPDTGWQNSLVGGFSCSSNEKSPQCPKCINRSH
jgi:hypothetical protein